MEYQKNLQKSNIIKSFYFNETTGFPSRRNLNKSSIFPHILRDIGNLKNILCTMKIQLEKICNLILPINGKNKLDCSKIF